MRIHRSSVGAGWGLVSERIPRCGITNRMKPRSMAATKTLAMVGIEAFGFEPGIATSCLSSFIWSPSFRVTQGSQQGVKVRATQIISPRDACSGGRQSGPGVFREGWCTYGSNPVERTWTQACRSWLRLLTKEDCALDHRNSRWNSCEFCSVV